VLEIRKSGLFLGLMAGIFSIFLWFILIFFNPYSTPGPNFALITFSMLFLPSCLAIYASFTLRKYLMLIAFLWSLPISLYLIGSPGVFALFGITSLLYIISFFFMLLLKKGSNYEP
jgi:hypothetical protein